MTPEQLKSSILQQAIQGRLVPQDPKEGSAEDLYQQIQAEKARLLKEKKIKKGKPLPEITDEEIPFEIPENWKWVRWGDISLKIQYGYSAPAIANGNIKMLRISDIQNNKVNWSTVPFCNITKEDTEQYKLQKNDILFARTGGTVGKSYIVNDVSTPSVFAGYLIRTQYGDNLAPLYLKAFMESDLYWRQLRNGTIATAQPNCNGKTLSKMIMPLPPLSEQERIVAKIEQLLPMVEQYGKAYKKLQTYQQRFPEDLKKSILQQAIQGKLVPQDPAEGSAEDLYQQIQAEKVRLLKEKKIKKGKPLPEITEEEIPFEIPESWKWVRLRNIVYDHGQIKPITNFVYIDIGAMDNVHQKLADEEKVLSPENAPSRARRVVKKEDIVYSTVRPYLHNMCIINKEFSHPPIASTGLAVMATYEGVNNSYLFYYLLSPEFDSYANSNQNSKGVAYPAINDQSLYRAPIPLPPLAEQKRIVAKIESLLPLVEKLQKK